MLTKSLTTLRPVKVIISACSDFRLAGIPPPPFHVEVGNIETVSSESRTVDTYFYGRNEDPSEIPDSPDIIWLGDLVGQRIGGKKKNGNISLL